MPVIHFVVTWLITAFGLWLVTRIVPGVQVRSARGLWLGALVLGLVNAVLRPVLWLLTLPLTVLTFGLFALVVNALLIQLAAWLVPDFEVKSFGVALLAALVMALLGLIEFIVSQFLMLGSVHWIIIEQGSRGVYL